MSEDVQRPPLAARPPGPPAIDGRFDRRTFLDALLAVGFVSTAAAIAYPVALYLVPPPSGEPETATAVAAKAGDLKPN